MPLINGCKYSCEPCIRGHRATSCKHTDRILVEVRKPGRPLQSCGHKLDTCVCGRLVDAFSIGNNLPIPLNETFGQEAGSTLKISKIPRSKSSSGKSKPNHRPRDQSKVKKTLKTKLISPTASPSRKIESERALDLMEVETQAQTRTERQQDSQRPTQSSALQVNMSPTNNTPISSPNYSFLQPRSPLTFVLPPITPLLGASNLMSSPTPQSTNRTREVQIPYLQGRHTTQSLEY